MEKGEVQGPPGEVLGTGPLKRTTVFWRLIVAVISLSNNQIKTPVEPKPNTPLL